MRGFSKPAGSPAQPASAAASRTTSARRRPACLLADLVEQLRALENGRLAGLDYRLHGHLRIAGIPGRVDFEHSDELLPRPRRTPGGTGVIRST